MLEALLEIVLGQLVDHSSSVLGRAWAARQPETTGDNTNQPVGKPQVKSNSYANPKVTESARTDYGSEGWGFESLRAC